MNKVFFIIVLGYFVMFNIFLALILTEYAYRLVLFLWLICIFIASLYFLIKGDILNERQPV